MKIQALFISDVHLGSKGSNADQVLDVLKKYQPEYLFLVGDIIDGWLLKRKFRWPQSHTNVLRKIMSYSKNGTKVIYIPGNHDDFLDTYLGLSMGNIHVTDEIIYKGVDKRLYYISHGDKLDVFSTKFKFIAKIGSIGYDFALWLNQWYNFFREWMGLPYYSLSKRIKENVKLAVNFVTDFEENAVKVAKQNKCDVAICGHIHKAEIKDGYMNSGDWCESCTALVEDSNGVWTIIDFHK